MSNVDERENEVQQTVYAILAVGFGIGLVLDVASVFSAGWWWNPLVSWLRDGDSSQIWKPLLAIVGLLVGQAVMFGAFQTARKYERTNPLLRRLLYGFNALFQLQLLLLFLIVANLLFQVRYPLPFDTTEGGFYSLSDKSKQLVSALEKPVHVFMVMDPSDGAYSDMKTVLTQLQQLNPKHFQVEDVATVGNKNRVAELSKRFPLFTGRGPGLLVAVGEPPAKETDPWPIQRHSFVSAGNLSTTDFADSGQRREFTGEVRLIQELTFLAEEKRKPIVYFTQGHGEPDMADRTNEGLSALTDSMSRTNYDVRPILPPVADAEKFSIPADADVVAIVGPTRSMAGIMPALRKYMNPTDPKVKKGKLLVLLGPGFPDSQRNNLMRETGLEALMAEFSVLVTNEQVFTYSIRGQLIGDFDRVILIDPPNAISSRHPVVGMLVGLMKAGSSPPVWQKVRRLEPSPSQGGPLQVEPLLLTEGATWTETDMRRDPEQTRKLIRAGDAEALKRRSTSPRTIVAAVSETLKDAEKGKGPVPRLMVFGCSTIATNENQQPPGRNLNYDVIRGSIDWLREREGNVGVEPKSHRYFEMPKLTSTWNLFFLPLAMMVVGVGGLGLIVWNIRRDSKA